MIADPLWSCVMLLCGPLWVLCGSFAVLCGPLRSFAVFSHTRSYDLLTTDIEFTKHRAKNAGFFSGTIYLQICQIAETVFVN